MDMNLPLGWLGASGLTIVVSTCKEEMSLAYGPSE